MTPELQDKHLKKLNTTYAWILSVIFFSAMDALFRIMEFCGTSYPYYALFIIECCTDATIAAAGTNSASVITSLISSRQSSTALLLNTATSSTLAPLPCNFLSLAAAGEGILPSKTETVSIQKSSLVKLYFFSSKSGSDRSISIFSPSHWPGN